jgi:hypothetical protein
VRNIQSDRIKLPTVEAKRVTVWHATKAKNSGENEKNMALKSFLVFRALSYCTPL